MSALHVNKTIRLRTIDEFVSGHYGTASGGLDARQFVCSCRMLTPQREVLSARSQQRIDQSSPPMQSCQGAASGRAFASLVD